MPAVTAQDLRTQATGLYNEVEQILGRESYGDADQAECDSKFAQAKKLEERAAAMTRLEEAKAKSQESAGRVVPETPLSEGNRKTHLGKLHEYSLSRAILAMADGRLEGLERECSDEIATRSQKPAKGFYVPHNLPMAPRKETRAVLDSSTGVGAVQIIVVDEIIQALRAKTLVNSLGCDIQNGLVGQVRFPKQSSLATWYWVGEGGEVGDGTPGLALQVTLTPKTIGAYVDIGRRFLVLTDVSENWVRSELLNALARGIDHTVFQGTGANNEPLGIVGFTDAHQIHFGNGVHSGGAISWAKCVEMETALGQANALDLGAMSNYHYVSTPGVRGQGKVTTKIASSQYSNFIWESDQTINGYAAHATTQMPSNVQLGTGGDLNCNSMIFGHFPSVLIGFWTGIDIIVDHITGAKSGLLRITALQDADVESRYDEAFSVAMDLKLT